MTWVQIEDIHEKTPNKIGRMAIKQKVVYRFYTITQAAAHVSFPPSLDRIPTLLQ